MNFWINVANNTRLGYRKVPYNNRKIAYFVDVKMSNSGFSELEFNCCQIGSLSIRDIFHAQILTHW